MSDTCFFCKREFDEHNKKEALVCLEKIVKGRI